MATLYKRATKEQQLMLRIVAGAVRNAAHAHGMVVDKDMVRFARSVAKRAVGTLTAHWSEVGSKRAIGTLSAQLLLGAQSSEVPGELASGPPDGQLGHR